MKTNLLFLIFILLQYNSYPSDCVDESQKFYNSKQYHKSINKIYFCLEDAIDSRHTEKLSELYYGLGINYSKLGELDSSLKYFKLAKFTSLGLENTKLKALIHNEIAITYTNLGLNHKSIKFLKISLEINRKLNRKKGMLINYVNLGHSFFNISLLDSSFYYYRLAYNLNPNNQDLTASILNNMASVEFSLGNYANSKFLLEKVLKTTSEKNTNQFLYESNYDLTQIALGKRPIYNSSFKKNDFKSSVKYLNEADISYKRSIYFINEGKFDKALESIINCNEIYFQNENYTKARLALSNFITLLKKKNSIDFQKTSKAQEQLNMILEKEQMHYSKLLLAETQRNIEINGFIKDLRKKLHSANMNIYLLLSLIVSLIILIPVTIRYIIVNRLLNNVKTYNGLAFSELHLLHENGVKNKLALIVNYIFLDNKYDTDDTFIELLDELVNNTNKLSKLINTKKQGEIDAKTTSTIKLSMDR